MAKRSVLITYYMKLRIKTNIKISQCIKGNSHRSHPLLHSSIFYQSRFQLVIDSDPGLL